jgi:opacity protein-like surface antigen
MKMIAAALLAALVMAPAAQAQMRPRQDPQSYLTLFGEYDHFRDAGLDGGGGGLGWTLNRYLGLQAGGQYFRKSGVDLTNLYGEVKLSWPLADRLSVYASIGGAYAEGSASVTLLTFPPRTVTVSTSASGYRAGLGAEYWLSNHWGLRAGWHRQNTGGVDDDISAGIAFRF